MSTPAMHLVIQARPENVPPGPRRELDGVAIATLAPSPVDLAQPFGVSFEQAAEALEQLPRLSLEPDGSFFWVGHDARGPWQLDGLLFDRDERLMTVELKGTCPAAALDRMLTTLGWPDTPVLLQMVQQSIYVGEEDFRRWAKHVGAMW
jgi:hypothetical protein